MTTEKIWHGSIFQRALDTLFPEDCCNCEKPVSFEKERYLCRKCKEKINWLTESNSCFTCAVKLGPHVEDKHNCPSCKGKNFSFTRSISAAEYDSPIKKVIHAFKYENAKDAAKPLSKLLWNRLKDIEEVFKADCIVPVPLHKKRLRQRGYNQASELAGILSKIMQIPVDNSLITRVKDTRPQAMLKMSERIKNPKGAFAVSGKAMGKSCVLVDDVVTTGATMSECAMKLREAGFNRIYAASIAR